MLEYLLSQSVHVLVLGVVLWYLGACYATGVFAALLDDEDGDVMMIVFGIAWPVSLPIAIVVVIGLALFRRVGVRGVSMGQRLREMI